MTFESGAHSDEQSALEALTRSVTMLSAVHRHHDPYTVLHQQRTAELAVAIGERLKLGPTRLALIGLAAKIHDIGKIAVPIQILFRPDALTQPEFEQIKTHAVVGGEVLTLLQSEFSIAPIVAQHHERIDGSGYPEGLRGSKILQESRVLAVADVFDAMISKRPYRDGLPRSFVIDTLREMSGRQLDSDAVDACLACV